MGQLANDVRAALEQALEERGTALEAAALERRLKDEALDVTIPGEAVTLGRQHPMNIALDANGSCFSNWPGGFSPPDSSPTFGPRQK